MSYWLVLFIIPFFLLSACGTAGSDGDGQSSTTEKFSKTWAYIDTGKEISLDDNTSETIDTVDDNLISITDDYGKSRHLIRKGINNVQISAQVTSLRTATSSSPTENTQLTKNSTGTSGIAGINVILQNINKGPAVTTYSDDSGQISAGVPTGTYDITSTDSNGNAVEAIVSVNGEETEIGTLTLADPNGYNFKVELIMDQNFVYGDSQTYTGSIRVHNTGSVDGTGLSFNVDCVDVYIQNCVVDNVLGSIPAGSYKDIPISVSFKFLDAIRYKLSIPVTITDVNYQQWLDPALLTVYKSAMRVNIVSKENYVKGFLIAPGRKLIHISTNSTTLRVPYQPDKQYTLLVANTTDATGETAYSIGLDTAVEDLTSFTNTGAFEPNNTENQAQTITAGTTISAYLHDGDLDYYIINMPQVTGTAPVELAYHSTSALYDRDSTSYATSGNDDSTLNAGETATFSIAMENTGTSAAMDALVTLDTSDPYITVTNVNSDANRTVTFGAGEIRDTDGTLSTLSWFNDRVAGNDFSISADLSTPIGHVATINITMTDRYGNTWNDSFTITVEGINASIIYNSTSALYDRDSTSYATSGNDDSTLNAGETATFSIAMENTGTSAAMDALVTLDTSDPYITVTNVNSDANRTVTFGAGEIRDTDGTLSTLSWFNDRVAGNDFSISADLSTPIGHVATINITMTDRYGYTWNDTFTITIQ